MRSPGRATALPGGRETGRRFAVSTRARPRLYNTRFQKSLHREQLWISILLWERETMSLIGIRVLRTQQKVLLGRGLWARGMSFH